MTLSEEELRDRIEEAKRSIDRTVDLWDEIPEDRRPIAHFGLGNDNLRIALYTALLSDFPAARDRFGSASTWYLKNYRSKRGQQDEVQRLMWALLASILSKDEEIRELVLDDVVDIEHRDPDYFYQFDRCLAGLLGDEEAVVSNAASTLTESEQAATDNLNYYAGLGDTCRSIVDDDMDRMDEGVGEILGSHEPRFPRIGERTFKALVCIPATALLILAHERGMDVTSLSVYDSEYVPWEFVVYDP